MQVLAGSRAATSTEDQAPAEGRTDLQLCPWLLAAPGRVEAPAPLPQEIPSVHRSSGL